MDTAAPERENVLTLLSHFKDADGGPVSTLIGQLEELSKRTQAADIAADPRLHSSQASRGSKQASWMHSGPGKGQGSFSSAAEDDKLSGVMSMVAKRSFLGGQSTFAGPARASSGQVMAGLRVATHAHVHIKVEDAQLPMPPSATSSPLPTPAGGHEWVALQAAVNDAVEQFSGPRAKMGWKKWALTQHHSMLVVSLFWWTLATVFKGEHSFSGPIQDYAFGHFCRHYVNEVLRLKGKLRDLYQQVWIDMLGKAVLYLLAEVHPKSSHKFDDDLMCVITKQLRLWTAGTLPSDLHPSVMADAHDMSPAAFSFAQLQAQPNGKPAGSATGLRQTDARAGSPPGMPAGVHLGASAASFTAHAGVLHPPISAQAAYLQATVQAQRTATGAAAAASSSPATASALHTSGSSRQGPKQALRFEDDALAGRQPQAGSSSVDSRGLRYDQWHEAAGSSMEHHQAQMQASSHAGHYALPPLPIDPSHSPSTSAPRQHTDSSQGMDASTSHTVPHGLKVTQAFVTSKASPALVALLGDAVSAGVVQGLHNGQSSLGGRAYMRRALDEADGDISYKRFAATATASAAEAVAAYEASKKARAAEVASMRRSLAESRDAIDVKHKAALASSLKGGSGAAAGASFSGATGLLGATITSVTSVNGRSRPGSSHGASAPHVKDLANRLSGWLLNDVDRALAGQPMNCDVPPSSHGRRTQTTRLMAPLNSVRKLEASIHGALSGARHNSIDAACRVAVSAAARDAQVASEWRPLAGARVGSKDIKRSRQAREAMLTVDFHKYM